MPARPPGGAGLPPASTRLTACSWRLRLWWWAGTDCPHSLSADSDSVPTRRAAKWRRWVPAAVRGGMAAAPLGSGLHPFSFPPLISCRSALNQPGGGRGEEEDGESGSIMWGTRQALLYYFFRLVSTHLAKFSVPRVYIAPGRWRSPLGEGGEKPSGAPPRRALLLLLCSIPLNFSESFAATRPGHRLSLFPCVGVMFEPGWRLAVRGKLVCFSVVSNTSTICSEQYKGWIAYLWALYGCGKGKPSNCRTALAKVWVIVQLCTSNSVAGELGDPQRSLLTELICSYSVWIYF